MSNAVTDVVLKIVGVGPVDRLVKITNLPASMVDVLVACRPEGYPRALAASFPVVETKRKAYMMDSPDGPGKIRVGGEAESFKGTRMIDMMVRGDTEALTAIESYVLAHVALDKKPTQKLHELAKPVAEDHKSPFSLQDITEVPTIELPAIETVAVAPERVAEQESRPTAEGRAHTCENKGRYAKYAPEGTCPRCDLLRKQRQEEKANV